MFKNLLKEREGFTLIEIIFVLAIAALIIIIVFLAIAGARNAADDQASKDWAGRLAAACDKWAGDSNNGNTAGCQANAAVVTTTAGVAPARAAAATINAADVTVTLKNGTVYHATF